MKFKNVNLEWYAYYMDFNGDLKPTNVLYDMAETLQKCLKSKDNYWRIDTRDRLRERIKRQLWGRYASRCEYEFLCTDLFKKDAKLHKVDVYEQLEPNLDRIVDYIAHEMHIEFDKKGNIIK